MIVWQNDKYRLVKKSRPVRFPDGKDNEGNVTLAYYDHFIFEQKFNDAMGETSWRSFATFDRGKKPTKVTVPVSVIVAILESVGSSPG